MIFFLAGRNMLKQQLQTGRIDMPSIANTLKDSGAVDLTLKYTIMQITKKKKGQETG